MTSFTEFGLPPRLLETITSLGYVEPTPVQKEAIPRIASGKDLLAAAQTGTGKTAAFVIPLLLRLDDGTVRFKSAPRFLVLVPTRELAIQVRDSILQLGDALGVKATAVYGGVGINPQKAVIAKGVDFLVATPGRLLDLMNRRMCDVSHIECLVLDEADRMLDLGFLPDLERILKKVPAGSQKLMFSATFPQEVMSLVDKLAKNMEKVEIEKNREVSSVTQVFYRVPKSAKPKVVRDLIVDNQWRQVLIFTRTKDAVDKLAGEMKLDGFDVKAIHGDKTQAARIKALNEFKEKQLPILITTDVASRGLDIEKLPHVLNYELPEQAEDYLHRIGRTGRAGETGEAISLVSQEDRPRFEAVKKFLKKDSELLDFPGLRYSDYSDKPTFKEWKANQNKVNLQKRNGHTAKNNRERSEINKKAYRIRSFKMRET